jgi:hypothetical protein
MKGTAMTSSISVDDDEVLRELIPRIVRRRTAGFTPVLVVSIDEDDRFIFDSQMPPDKLQEFLEELPTINTESLDEPEAH